MPTAAYLTRTVRAYLSAREVLAAYGHTLSTSVLAKLLGLSIPGAANKRTGVRYFQDEELVTLGRHDGGPPRNLDHSRAVDTFLTTADQLSTQLSLLPIQPVTLAELAGIIYYEYIRRMTLRKRWSADEIMAVDQALQSFYRSLHQFTTKTGPALLARIDADQEPASIREAKEVFMSTLDQLPLRPLVIARCAEMKYYFYHRRQLRPELLQVTQASQLITGIDRIAHELGRFIDSPLTYERDAWMVSLMTRKESDPLTIQ